MAEAEEMTVSQEAEPVMTGEEIYQRIKALVSTLEKGATKTMLVYYVANRIVSHGLYLHGTHAGIDQEEARLLDELKSWKNTGRDVNRHKRVMSLLAKLDENHAAEEAGRKPPHKFKTPKRRKKPAARRAKV
ncbi:hypothetical protein [Roseomonas genomospecies 6]|uniref:hypothetical protein n=1 Tax=Roseomonas genomospecies 6 TaxID=214106 RepID=UPI0011F3C8E8|nr:hypothetical protein [Roseomonas genomospecies 6]